jgi:hypothetical protein
MLVNGVEQSSSTLGAGALTIAAITGAPRLIDAQPVLGVRHPYELVDKVTGMFIEAGWGYLTDATTFVRAKVTATLSGGVYNSSNPTPVNLTGDTILVLGPHASTLESMLPTVDNQSSGVSRYLTSAHRNLSTTVSGPSGNNIQYMPFLLRCGARVSSLAVNVTTQGVGDTARLGLYHCNEKGYLGAMLASTGSLDLGTTGVKDGPLSSPLTLPPGWYFTGFIASSGTPRLTAYASGVQNQMGGSPFGFNSSLTPIELRTEAVGSTALPNLPGVTTSAQPIGNLHPILVYVGVTG